ncbi:hypothetical protein ABZP36_013044 [Zizania latifolia]
MASAMRRSRADLRAMDLMTAKAFRSLHGRKSSLCMGEILVPQDQAQGTRDVAATLAEFASQQTAQRLAPGTDAQRLAPGRDAQWHQFVAVNRKRMGLSNLWW